MFPNSSWIHEKEKLRGTIKWLDLYCFKVEITLMILPLESKEDIEIKNYNNNN